MTKPQAISLFRQSIDAAFDFASARVVSADTHGKNIMVSKTNGEVALSYVDVDLFRIAGSEFSDRELLLRHSLDDATEGTFEKVSLAEARDEWLPWKDYLGARRWEEFLPQLKKKLKDLPKGTSLSEMRKFALKEFDSFASSWL